MKKILFMRIGGVDDLGRRFEEGREIVQFLQSFASFLSIENTRVTELLMREV
jgi:hypothetical protein